MGGSPGDRLLYQLTDLPATLTALPALVCTHTARCSWEANMAHRQQSHHRSWSIGCWGGQKTPPCFDGMRYGGHDGMPMGCMPGDTSKYTRALQLSLRSVGQKSPMEWGTSRNA